MDYFVYSAITASYRLHASALRSPDLTGVHLLLLRECCTVVLACQGRSRKLAELGVLATDSGSERISIKKSRSTIASKALDRYG